MGWNGIIWDETEIYFRWKEYYGKGRDRTVYCDRVSCVWLFLVEYAGLGWVEARRLILQAGQNGRGWYKTGVVDSSRKTVLLLASRSSIAPK